MSTRTHVIIDHQMPDYRDRKATVALLQPSIPAALAVDDYWHTVEPDDYVTPTNSWIPQREHTVVSYLDYLGPGSILLHFSQQVVVVSASARWSGFLTIEPLRNIHLSAFRSIAQCLRGTRLVLLPDASDVGYDAMRDGLPQEQCIARLRKDYGPPQSSVENIAPDAFTRPIPGSHLVWFVETL